MPRLARRVFAGIPHHITQRGNRKEDVFFDDYDRAIYLKWLGEYCRKFSVDILSYCLMSNHTHLVLRPASVNGLQQVLKPLHMRYAQRINKAKGQTGHLWQGRYFSSPLDEIYTWSAIRYVERNPIRAGLIEQAENYPWSSAAAHCGLKASSLLVSIEKERPVSERQWSNWLAVEVRDESLKILRKNVRKGTPCGSDEFIKKLKSLRGDTL